jgi:hypothetical protein
MRTSVKSGRLGYVTVEGVRSVIRGTIREFVDRAYKQIGLNARVSLWLA